MKPFADFRKWRTDGLLPADGFLVGSDMNQEWLLPWWWDHYSRHNSHPVAFADFGLSPEMKEWCKQRGEYIRIPIPDVFVAEKEEIDPSTIHLWEKDFGAHFWSCRSAWFKKPLACLQSPFKRTAWIDLDCEIRASLKEIFPYCEHPSQLGIARDCNPEWLIYNSGVFVFKRGAPIILEWAERSFDLNPNFYGDQELLTHLILDQKLEINQLPYSYNWSRCIEENPDALVYHWHGTHGKTVIAHQIQTKNLAALDL